MLIIILGDNMNILFTGAVSGIANSVVNELLKFKKYNIYLTVETDTQLKNVKEKYKNNPRVSCFKLNVTNVHDREKLKDLNIDILVNNAAIGYGGSIAEIPMSKVRKNFEINVFSTFEIIQIVLKNMIKKGKGRVIVISSIAGIIPFNFLGSYSATKSSVTTLTTTLKNEMKLINKNIKIVLIEPGLYHTGFNQVMFENKYDWMIKESYFKENLDKINNKEKLMLSIMEKRKLDSIVNKIVEAITTKNPKFIYRAPFTQAMTSKIYDLFFR